MLFGSVIVAYVIMQAVVSLLTEYSLGKGGIGRELFRKTRAVRLIIYIALALLPCLGALLPENEIKFTCMKWGNLWLGYFIYYAGMLLILSGIAAIVCRIRKDSEKKIFSRILYFVTVFAAVITVCGLIHAQRPQVVTYDADTGKNSGKTLKVVLIADLHLSVNSVPETTEKIVEMINSCEADVVVIAGDIFTSNYAGLKDPDRYSAALSKIEAKYGVYAVAGNHDVDENLFGGFSISPVSKAFRTNDMEDFFADCGFKMLYDEYAELGGTGAVLIGRIDGEKAGDGTSDRKNEEEIMAGHDPDKLNIVLQHEPMGYEGLAKNGADIVLSGHTHDGQLFPGNLVVPFFNENAYGYKVLHGMPTVVTAGTGYYGPPMRVGTNSEITVVNISY